jgi:hypothetical protein
MNSDYFEHEIRARQPSITRALNMPYEQWRDDPYTALLEAFDALVDENKRYYLGDKRLLALIRAKM